MGQRDASPIEKDRQWFPLSTLQGERVGGEGLLKRGGHFQLGFPEETFCLLAAAGRRSVRTGVHCNVTGGLALSFHPDLRVACWTSVFSYELCLLISALA